MTETISKANAKAASVVNVLRERESCAVIADKFKESEDLTKSDKFAEGYRLACEDIAKEIRAQSTDFKTMEEVLSEEGQKASDFVRGGKLDQFKGDVHHG